MSADKTSPSKDANISRNGFVGRNLLFQNYPSQLLALQQQHDRLLALRDQSLSQDPILAAAVQRQLMAASLGSSGSMSLYALGNHPRLGGSLVASHGSAGTTMINGGFPQGMQPRGNLPIISCSLKQVTDGILTKPSRVPMTKIPCQARGMASDHNSMTAFFEISCNTKHGQHLSCAHAGCRASGVKFRYCEFCKKPVTKQNFRSRHLHADLLRPGGSNSPDAVSKAQTRKRRLSGDKKEVVVGKEQMSLGIMSGSSGPICLLQNDFPGAGKIEPTAGARFMSIEADSTTIPEQMDSMRLSRDTINDAWEERNLRWMALLTQRPHGLHGDLGPWLTTVLEVSEKSQDLKLEPGIQPGADSKNKHQTHSSNQVAAWKGLLDERPDMKSKGSETTEWLVKVLKVSCCCYQQESETC